MLFCSDIENKSIKIVKRDLNEEGKKFFSNIIDFFKIPHHGSSGANEILNLLGNVQIEDSVTTTYYVGEKYLPKNEMLKQYKNKSGKLYATADVKDRTSNIHNYGIVEITVDIFKREIKAEEVKYDAIEI